MNFDFLKVYYPLYIEGTITTLTVSFFTVTLGTLIGITLAIMKLSKNDLLKFVASSYIEIVRGTPLIVQALLLFALITLPDFYIGNNFNLARAIPGILALSINSSAYIAEIIRAGILAVDKGQREAGESLGMNNFDIMKYIIMPQAIKNILPAIGNEFVVLIKESSILYIVGIQELMAKTDTIRASTYRPLEPLIVTSIIYFCITFSISKIIGNFERKLQKDARN